MLRRKSELEFVTNEPRVAAMYPPVPAARLAPEWWKKTSAYVPERRFPHLRLRRELTIKGCPGIADYLHLGFVVPMWTDMLIRGTDSGFAWEIPDATRVERFFPNQWELFPREASHEFVLKIDTPWRLRAPRGWSVLIVQPWYHQESRWSVMPGIVDSDRLSTINFVAVWHSPKEHTELIKAGTPMLHVIPFRRGGLPLSVVPSSTVWDELQGVGVNAVGGERIAPGAYRESARSRSSS